MFIPDEGYNSLSGRPIFFFFFFKQRLEIYVDGNYQRRRKGQGDRIPRRKGNEK